MRPFSLACVFLLLPLAIACGSDDDDASGGGSGGSTAADLCEQGCVATLAAACSNGPADQASCVSTCQSLESGSCGTEYQAFQACADGETITCDASSGIPVVEACATEQGAFIDCLN